MKKVSQLSFTAFITYSHRAVIVPASTMKFNNGSLVERVCKLLTTLAWKKTVQLNLL